MVPDDDSSEEEEGQSDSDSLGLDDDLGAIKVEINEEKKIDSNDDDDFYEDYGAQDDWEWEEWDEEGRQGAWEERRQGGTEERRK